MVSPNLSNTTESILNTTYSTPNETNITEIKLTIVNSTTTEETTNTQSPTDRKEITPSSANDPQNNSHKTHGIRPVLTDVTNANYSSTEFQVAESPVRPHHDFRRSAWFICFVIIFPLLLCCCLGVCIVQEIDSRHCTTMLH